MKLSFNSIKVATIASFTLAAVLIFIFGNSAVTTTHASIGGAPTGRTGAPGESACTSCHANNSQTGQLTIIAPATYTPGQTYTIQVQNTTTDTTRRAWGFELIPVTSANAMAGTVANLNANTRIRVSGTKSYVTHTTAGTFGGQTGGATWSFSWTAPASAVGAITMYAAGLQADNDGSEDGDQTYLKSFTLQPAAAVVIHHGFSDFDGDGKADASVFRPSTGLWYINRSSGGMTGVQWGISTDRLAPADFDGDDKADIAVWREDAATRAAFYIFQSSNNTVRTELFGQTGDDPTVVGDWDGDGKADPAVYHDSAFGSQSYFFYRGSLNNPSGGTTYVPFGSTGDKAQRGDFDGDGKLDLAVFRPANSVWYILQSSNQSMRYENWGLASDKFVPADYDGDSKTDVAVFRGGTWYIKQSSTGTPLYYQWGLDTDSLAPADYDGDGKTDVAIYRGGTWWVRQSSSGSVSVQNFGNSTDRPVPAAFVK